MDTFTIIGIATVVILAFTVHESAHAYVADKLGDPTARQLGRVSLNPLVHIDLVWTIMMPLIAYFTLGYAFGGAKPVPVYTHRMRNPGWCMMWIGVAGPASNFLMAVIWAGLLSLFYHAGVWQPDSNGVTILVAGIIVNLVLLVFNMIPIPPLDGSRVVSYHLKGKARKSYGSLERYGFFILIALLHSSPRFFQLLLIPFRLLGKLVSTLVFLPDAVNPFL